MAHRLALLSLAFLAFTAPAWAQATPHSQPPEDFKYLPAAAVNALTDKPGPGPKTAYLGDHENNYVEYATRSDAGNEAEMHTHWTHYVNVLSGEATLTYGGTVVHPRDTGPGQVRGSGITGGKSMTVHPGDFIQIPAGMPHMFNPASGVKFHYVVFNIRQ
jgi:glc operon protein GlcG